MLEVRSEKWEESESRKWKLKRDKDRRWRKKEKNLRNLREKKILSKIENEYNLQQNIRS